MSGIKNLNEMEKSGYAIGLNSMWTAFRYAAYDDTIDLKTAVFELGKWMDAVERWKDNEFQGDAPLPPRLNEK